MCKVVLLVTQALLGVLGVLAVPSRVFADVELVERSSGFLGAREEAPTIHRIWVSGGRLRAEEDGAGRATVCDLERGLVWEIDGVKKTYREHPLAYFADLRARAVEKRRAFAAQLAGIKDPAEREKTAKDLGLDPADDLPATLERSETDEKIAGRPVRRVRVLRGEKVVLDACLTDELPGTDSLIAVYKGLGLFPDDVAALLADVKGFPLRYEARLPIAVFDVLEVTVRGEAVSARVAEAPEGAFRVPEGFVREEDLSAEVVCEVCGKKVDRRAAVPLDFQGRRRWFCGHPCEHKFIVEGGD